MLRFTLVLVAASGCDVAFQLDHIDEGTPACGPFSRVSEVKIVGVGEPRQFSLTADEQLALVFGIDAQNRRRLIPLQWNGDAWEPHASYQVGLDNPAIVGARLAPNEETPIGDMYIGPVQPAMNAWFESNNRQQVSRLYWSGTAWTPDSNQGTLFDPDYDVRAGNVVLVRGAYPADRVRHTVIVKLGIELGVPNQIVLHANTPPSFNLLPKLDRTRALDEQAAAIGVMLSDSVLSGDQARLVYTAMSGGQSDIYATAQSSLREFGPGGLIADITTPDDEVEPWIDATCSKLYFRRIPAGTPNSPGQIFVAQ